MAEKITSYWSSTLPLLDSFVASPVLLGNESFLSSIHLEVLISYISYYSFLQSFDSNTEDPIEALVAWKDVWAENNAWSKACGDCMPKLFQVF